MTGFLTVSIFVVFSNNLSLDWIEILIGSLVISDTFVIILEGLFNLIDFLGSFFNLIDFDSLRVFLVTLATVFGVSDVFWL